MAADKDLSFEEALSELEKIVKTLESGGCDLKASIEIYERGVQLKKICEKKLADAQLKIEKISISDGSSKTEAFSAE